MSDKEKARVVVSDLVDECRGRLRLVQDIVGRNQNRPPEGQADGSIDDDLWTRLKIVQASMEAIVQACHYLIPPRPDIVKDPKVAFKNALVHRAERVKRLVELDAPIPVIIQAVELVTKAGFCLDPDEMGKLIGRRIAQASRPNHGYCSTPGCQHALEGKREPPICQACLDDMLSVEDEQA